MNLLAKRARTIGVLLPQIARNLRIAALVDRVRQGLTLAQLTVLLILKDAREETMSMGEIAHELGVSFPTASGLVDRLSREGLATRLASDSDRRIVLVHLTANGKAVLRRMLRLLDDLLMRLLADMGEAEQESFVEAVDRVFGLSQLIRDEEKQIATVS
jgi:DNA-binding MarR family transcriptional regulator